MTTSSVNGVVLGCGATDQGDVLGEFELDVTVTTDAAVGYSVRRCDSSDTCGSTCASACASS